MSKDWLIMRVASCRLSIARRAPPSMGVSSAFEIAERLEECMNLG